MEIESNGCRGATMVASVEVSGEVVAARLLTVLTVEKHGADAFSWLRTAAGATLLRRR